MIPGFPATDKGYQSCDNSICRAHGKRASEDPQEIPHTLEESCSIKGVGILLRAVDGDGAERRREFILVRGRPQQLKCHTLFWERLLFPVTLCVGWEN